MLGVIFGFILFAGGCGETGAGALDAGVLRLAVTTSTRDTGLVDLLMAEFQEQHGVRVDVIAVGTGRALRLGKKGDVDVVLVHAWEAEQRFMAGGHGVRHEQMMVNRFHLLGPGGDSAGIAGLSAAAAFQEIGRRGQRFVSRGDDSGTHKREMVLWEKGGGLPVWKEYIESGQGMGATLIMADQMQAYTLSDRGTYLTFKDRIELVDLEITGDELRNPYGLLKVNPEKSNMVNGELADLLCDFLIAPETQMMIRDFKIDGESLFHPLRLPEQQ